MSVWTGKGNMGRVKQIKALSSIYLFVLTHGIVVAELVGLIIVYLSWILLDSDHSRAITSMILSDVTVGSTHS